MQVRTQKYVTGTFILHSIMNFYQIKLAGKNSIIRIYDHTARLCISRKIVIPISVIRTIACDRYLINFSADMIEISDVTCLTAKSISCLNTKIKEIKHCIYNKQSNLFFIVDDQNRLFYLMPTMIDIQYKMLYDCKAHKIHSQVTKIGANSQAHIYLYFQQKNQILKLMFNLQTDTLSHKQSFNNIVDMYCNSNWDIKITQKTQRISSSIQQTQYYQIQINNDMFLFNLPKNQYIIKQNEKQLVIFDLRFKYLCLIKDGNFDKFQTKQNYTLLSLPERVNLQTPLIFQTHKTLNNQLKIIINVYNGIQTPFDSFETILQNTSNQEFNQNDQKFKLLVYLHNNIELIFNLSNHDKNILNPYYITKIKKCIECYADNGQNNGSENELQINNQGRIAIKFLTILLENSPKTMMKLIALYCHNMKKQFNENNPHSFVRKYFQLIELILQNKGVQLLEKYRQISKSGLNVYEQYNINCSMLQQIIKSISIILYNLKTQNFLRYQKQQKVYDSESICPLIDESLLNNAKSLYLLNQLVKRTHQVTYKFTKWSLKLANKIKSTVFGQPPYKLTFCHYLFGGDYFTTENSNRIQSILTFIANSNNFYHSAYMFYTLINNANKDVEIRAPSTLFSNISSIQDKQQPNQIIIDDQPYEQIPYLNDPKIYELIKFLDYYSFSVQSNDDEQFNEFLADNSLRTQIYEMASRVLLIRQPAFIKYICNLSIVYGLEACCSIILNSGALQLLRSRKKHQSFKYIRTEIIFMMRLYISTSKVHECLEYLINLKKQSSRYQLHEFVKIEYEQLIRQFVNECVSKFKTKVLFQLLHQQRHQDQFMIINNELQKIYGEQPIKQIRQMWA